MVGPFLIRQVPTPGNLIFPMLNSRFFSRKDLQRRWGCSLSTIKRLEKQRVLNPIQIGPRTLRYRADDIEKIDSPKPAYVPDQC